MEMILDGQCGAFNPVLLQCLKECEKQILAELSDSIDTTDKPTVVNMTNHAYFNLNADATIPITNNILYVNADEYTPVDSTFMTSGEIAPVANTPFDFNTPTEIGARINEDNEQLHNGNGYDHNWVLKGGCDIQRLAAGNADYRYSRFAQNG